MPLQSHLGILVVALVGTCLLTELDRVTITASCMARLNAVGPRAKERVVGSAATVLRVADSPALVAGVNEVPAVVVSGV